MQIYNKDETQKSHKPKPYARARATPNIIISRSMCALIKCGSARAGALALPEPEIDRAPIIASCRQERSRELCSLSLYVPHRESNFVLYVLQGYNNII